MPSHVISEREFVDRDQEWFAAVSGDRNPIHMDPVVARRTLAGTPITHGIHVLLWALNSLFQHLPNLGPEISLEVRFDSMVHVGDRVQAILAQRDAERLHVDVVVEGIRAIRIDVAFNRLSSNRDLIRDAPLYRPDDPLTPTFEQMDGLHGRVAVFSASDKICRMFPAAATKLGARRVAGLACSSFLVGMVCPGLNSVYLGLNLVMAPSNEDDHAGLHFQVANRYPGSRRVRLAVAGAGWIGSIDALVRAKPTTQADLAVLMNRVAPGEFNGASALVVGGSRGLGELIAKVLAVGGAHITLTYSIGEADTRRLQADIVAYRRALQYNALRC